MEGYVLITGGVRSTVSPRYVDSEIAPHTRGTLRGMLSYRGSAENQIKTIRLAAR